MFDVEHDDMMDAAQKTPDDAQSQQVVSKNNNVVAGVRPVSHHHNTRNNSRVGVNRSKNSGVIVRKNRVKSTRPGGIRGGVLVQDKYSSNTPVSTKKGTKR